MSAILQCSGQFILIDKKEISKNNIRSIKFSNVNPIDFENEYPKSGNEKCKTIFNYDKNGFLLSLQEIKFNRQDTISERKTIHIYCDNKIFMTVSKEVRCKENHLMILKGDSCFPHFTFKIFEKINESTFFKSYEADDELDIYFNRFFVKNPEEWDLYLREMKWKEKVHNIHYIDPPTRSKILSEIFIQFTYITEESGDPFIDEESGDTIVTYRRDEYYFDENNFMDDGLIKKIPNEDEYIKIKRSQMQFISSNKKFKKKVAGHRIFKIQAYHDYFIGIEIIDDKNK